MFFMKSADLAKCAVASVLKMSPVYGLVLGKQGTAGCGLSHSVDQSTDAVISSGGRDRQFRIHVPRFYKPDAPAPLLISFHGATKTMTDQERITSFSNGSVNPSMITVYPQGLVAKGVGTSWGGAPYHQNLPNDKVFVSDLISHLKSQYCVDASRIYANGISNGGGFVNTLACSPDPGASFAAFAPVSGAVYDDDVDTGPTTCDPARLPLPVLEFYGLADDKIPYFGPESDNGPVPSIPNWLAAWAHRKSVGIQPLSAVVVAVVLWG